MVCEAIETKEIEDLGFQAKHPIDLFPGSNQDELRSLMSSHALNFLTISYSRGIIFAYLNHELKLISTNKLSEFLEPSTEDMPLDTNELVLNTFKINDNVTQIKLNADESSLYMLQLKDGSTYISSIDVSILLKGTFNEQILFTIPSNNTVLRLLPSPNNSQSLLILSDKGDVFLFEGSQVKELLHNVSGVNWFNRNLVFSKVSDLCVNFFDITSKKVIDTFSLEKEQDNESLFYFKQVNDTSLLAVSGEEIDSNGDQEYRTFFIQLSGYKPTKIEQTDTLFTPYGSIPRVSSFYTLSLTKWAKIYPELLISVDSKSTDITPFLFSTGLEILNDQDRATMPMPDDSDDDDTPLGIVLDLNSTVNVKEPCKGIDESGPLPRIIVLTNRGQLISWNIWSKHDILNEGTSLESARKQKIITSSSSIPVETIPNLGSLSFSKDEQKLPAVSQNSIFSSTSKSTNPFGSSNLFSGFNSSNNKATNASLKPIGFGTVNNTTPKGSFGQAAPTSSTSSGSPIAAPFGAGSINNSSFGSSATGFGRSSFGGSGLGGFKMGAQPAVRPNPGQQMDKVTANSSLGGGFAKFNAGTSPFGSAGKNTTASSPFASLGKTSSSSPFGSLSKPAEPVKSQPTLNTETKNASSLSGSIFGSVDKTNSPFNGSFGLNKSPFGSLAAATPIAASTNNTGIFNASSKTNFSNSSLFGTVPSTNFSHSFNSSTTNEPSFNAAPTPKIEELKSPEISESETESESEPESDHSIAAGDHNEEEQEDVEGEIEEIESELEELEIDPEEQKPSIPKENITPETSFIPPKIEIKSEKPHTLSMEEEFDTYNFELNLQATSNEAIALLLKMKDVKTNATLPTMTYEEFLQSRRSYYKENLEDIDKIVSEFERKLEEEKKKLEMEKELEFQARLSHLRKIKEERNRVFLQAENERKAMMEALKLENLRKRTELEKLGEELKLREEIDEELKKLDEFGAETERLLQQQLEEMENMNRKQIELIEKEEELERQRLKDLEIKKAEIEKSEKKTKENKAKAELTLEEREIRSREAAAELLADVEKDKKSGHKKHRKKKKKHHKQSEIEQHDVSDDTISNEHHDFPENAEESAEESAPAEEPTQEKEPTQEEEPKSAEESAQAEEPAHVGQLAQAGQSAKLENDISESETGSASSIPEVPETFEYVVVEKSQLDSGFATENTDKENFTIGGKTTGQQKDSSTESFTQLGTVNTGTLETISIETVHHYETEQIEVVPSYDFENIRPQKMPAKSLLVSAKYSNAKTVCNTPVNSETSFEDDESYLSKFYIPKAVPLVHVLGNVEYPKDFDDLPPVGREMKKLIYDVFVGFNLLHKNTVNLNEFLADHLNDKILFHTLEKSFSCPNFWRLFEIETVHLSTEFQNSTMSKVAEHYSSLETDVCKTKESLFRHLRRISQLTATLKGVDQKVNEFNTNFLDLQRPLSFKDIKTKRILKGKLAEVKEIEKLLQYNILILKSEVYPEKIVEDKRNMQSVISMLQRSLYEHADTINSLTEELSQRSTPEDSLALKHSSEESISASVSVVRKSPISGISRLAMSLKAKQQFIDAVRNKPNNNRFISLEDASL